MIAGSCAKSMLSFVRNCRIVFQSDCMYHLGFLPAMRVPVAPHPCQHLVSSVSWILAILIRVWWFLIVTLLCIFLMMYNVEHLFIGLLAICIALVRCLFTSFTHFWIGWLIFSLLSFRHSLHILNNSRISDMSLQIFLLSLWIVFSFS